MPYNEWLYVIYEKDRKETKKIIILMKVLTRLRTLHTRRTRMFYFCLNLRSSTIRSYTLCAVAISHEVVRRIALIAQKCYFIETIRIPKSFNS